MHRFLHWPRSAPAPGAVALLVSLVLPLAATHAQPSYIHYQGNLTVDDGSGGQIPFNGAAAFKFVIVDTDGLVSLWSNDGSSSIGEEPDEAVTVEVFEGLYSVYLGVDMEPLESPPLAGEDGPSLRIWVDTGTGFDRLDDLPIGAAPYAFHADGVNEAYGSFPVSGFIESTSGGLRFPDTTTQTTASSIEGMEWDLHGNTGTAGGAHFVGTRDFQDFHLGVGGAVGLRLRTVGGVPNLVGGSSGNDLVTLVEGARIGGGGSAGSINRVNDSFGVIVGGRGGRAGNGNASQTDAMDATVVGGEGNHAVDAHASVGGGAGNSASGVEATVLGGASNSAAEAAVVLGGSGNEAGGLQSAIAGGTGNTITGGATNAVIVTGTEHHLEGVGAIIVNGFNHTVTSSYVTVGGHKVDASASGSFVWSDQSDIVNAYPAGVARSVSMRVDGGLHVADPDNGVRIEVLPDTLAPKIRTPMVELVGGADIAEPFVIAGSRRLEPGSVVVIDGAQPGAVRLSERAYDHRVVGVISGAGGVRAAMTAYQAGHLDGGQPVALRGRVHVLADATGSPIAPGDLLTTSDRAGHAMAAADERRREGAILGKALSGLESGTGLVLVLVGLQ